MNECDDKNCIFAHTYIWAWSRCLKFCGKLQCTKLQRGSPSRISNAKLLVSLYPGEPYRLVLSSSFRRDNFRKKLKLWLNFKSVNVGLSLLKVSSVCVYFLETFPNLQLKTCYQEFFCLSFQFKTWHGFIGIHVHGTYQEN